MPGYNHITVIGHLGKDPELRYTPQGTAICSFTMAVNQRKKLDGVWQDQPLWFKVQVFGKQAESVNQFLSKGKPCLVAGTISTEEWTNRDGKNVTTLVINALGGVTFLGDGSNRSQEGVERPKASTSPQPAVTQEITDDDIPF